jgi:hypothetical protein
MDRCSVLVIYLFICNIVQLVTAHAGHFKKDDFEFNGASDYLQIPPNPSFDSIIYTQHISIEVTLRISELDRQQSLIEKYGCTASNAESGGFYLRISATNLICFAIMNHCVDYVEYCGQTMLKVNAIYHIAATYAEGKVGLYINGTYDFAQTDNAQVAPYSDSYFLTE